MSFRAIGLFIRFLEVYYPGLLKKVEDLCGPIVNPAQHWLYLHYNKRYMKKTNQTMWFFNLLRVQTFVALMSLKLTGHIDWSWWLVTAPLWIGDAIIAVRIIVAIIEMVYDAYQFNRSWKTIKR